MISCARAVQPWLVICLLPLWLGAAETVETYVPFSSAAEAQAVANILPPMGTSEAEIQARMIHFMNGADPSFMRQVDSDGDGSPDAMEIALGTDPNDPNSLLKITSATSVPASGKFRLTWPSASGVLYRVWTSPDLINWSIVCEWTNAASTPVETSEFNPVPTNAFFKIEAQIQ